MRPCPDRREAVLLHAAGALKAASVGELDRHLQTCPHCRRLHRRARSLSDELGNAFARAPVQVPSLGFHARVLRAIHEPVSSGSGWAALDWWRPSLTWAGAGALILFVGWIGFIASRGHQQPATKPGPEVRISGAVEPRLPRRQAYVSALNRSLNEFDTLTQRDDNRLSADRPPVGAGRWE